MNEITVPGDPEYHGTCITATHCRHDASHCWGRAAIHIMRFTQLNFFERLEAAAICAEVVEAILQIPRPAKLAPRFGVTWGFGKGWPGLR